MATFLIVRTSDGVVVNACEGAPQAPVSGLEFVERVGQAAAAWIGWIRQADGSFVDPRAPASLTKDDLVAYAAAARLVIEEGGITMPDGSRVKTDRESQGLIDRAVSLANLFPSDPIDFKASTGWITLDAPTMLAIGKAVGLHVRSSFTNERRAAAAIAAGTATTAADVDRILAGG